MTEADNTAVPAGSGQAAAAAQPAVSPLQPPTATAPGLILTAPAPSQPVAATAAPSLAPAVDAAALPGLDAKVDTFLSALMVAEPRSPEFAAKATDVRSMGTSAFAMRARARTGCCSSP